HAAPEGDAYAGYLALERTKHQLLVPVQVEASPIEPIDLAEQEGGELCRIGDEIALAGQQCFQLRRQQRVALAALPHLLQIDHGFAPSSCWPTQLRANW